jgi:hypothetical protein
MKMEDIDFQPRRNSAILLVLFGLFFGLFSFGIYVSIRDLLEPQPVSWRRGLEAVAVLGIYLLGLFLVVFYVLFSPCRFRFTDEGMQVLTWRGRRFFPWPDVRRARFSVIRSGLFLELSLKGWSRVLVPVSWFGKAALLVREIRRRLAVPIEGGESRAAARILAD